jgi:hypothetical protein
MSFMEKRLGQKISTDWILLDGPICDCESIALTKNLYFPFDKLDNVQAIGGGNAFTTPIGGLFRVMEFRII